MDYRTIILDDEAINILLLKKIITEYCPSVKLVGEAYSIETAMDQINELDPHIIFLDVMIKDSLVFEMIDRLDYFHAQIIFVTSDSRFAFKAFRYNAIDYLLKPLVVMDVVKAVNKAISNIKMHNYMLDRDRNMTIKKDQRTLLGISSMEKIELIRTDEVMFFSSEGKYTTIYMVDDKKLLSTKNLGNYETMLDESIFYRIHHSYIINMNFVAKIVRKEGFYCEMSNGLVIPISKRKQDDFTRFIGVKE